MALYVDSARNRFGRMVMSHLFADTSEELAEAERALGIPRGSIHHPGQAKEHLDVSQAKRRDAIAMGAKEISTRQVARLIAGRRQQMTRAAEQQGTDE